MIQAYSLSLPELTSADPAISFTSIVSVVVTCCVKVDAAPVVTSLACPLEPSARKPAEDTSPPSMMSSPAAKSMSTVGHVPLKAVSTSAPANSTNVPAGISRS